jgi:hypothetical protein
MADFGRLATDGGVRSQAHPSKEEGNFVVYASLLSLAMIIAVVCLIILAGKKIKSDRWVLVLYFLGSCCILPLYKESTKDGVFRLWFPVGFGVVIVCLLFNKNRNRAKFRASLFGFSVALGLLFVTYHIITF